VPTVGVGVASAFSASALIIDVGCLNVADRGVTVGCGVGVGPAGSLRPQPTRAKPRQIMQRAIAKRERSVRYIVDL
jgi:hypothetical protein